MADNKIINADDLFQVLRDDININGANLARVRRHIDAAPVVDAVEVVRCKDCKYAVCHDEVHKTVLCQKRSAYPKQWDDMPFDGFCSYGERREGE